MTNTALDEFYLDGESIEVVESFNFLGSTIHMDGGIEQELRRRLSLGRTALVKLTAVMKNHDVSRNTKVMLMPGAYVEFGLPSCALWS